MRGELPPWVGAVEDSTTVSVDPRVLAGMTIWLIAFGWYVFLHALPRGDLSLSSAGVLYAAGTFAAGLCFGSGEVHVASGFRRFVDRSGLLLGGGAIATTGLAFYHFVPPTNPYVGGLWLGVTLLAAGLTIGAALR